MQVKESGLTPQTILLTKEDAQKLGLPNWTRQLMGLKVVIAGNIEYSKVVPNVYESVRLNIGKEDPGQIIQ